MDEESEDGIEVWHLVLAAAGVGIAYLALTSNEQGGGGAGGGGQSLTERISESVMSKVTEGATTTSTQLLKEIKNRVTETVVEGAKAAGEKVNQAASKGMEVGIDAAVAVPIIATKTIITGSKGYVQSLYTPDKTKQAFSWAGPVVTSPLAPEMKGARFINQVTKVADSLMNLFGIEQQKPGGVHKYGPGIQRKSFGVLPGPVSGPKSSIVSNVVAKAKRAGGAAFASPGSPASTFRMSRKDYGTARVGSVTSVTPMSKGRVRKTYKLGKGGLGKVSSVSYR